MKIAVFSDVHIHDFREFSVAGPDGVPSRLRACVSVLHDVRLYCQKHGIGVVVFGGDLFHRRGAIFTQAFNLVVVELALFKEAGITVLCVPGNHDQANRSGTIDAIEALADAGLVQAVNPTRGWVNWFLEDDAGDALLISGFGYTDSREIFLKRLDASTVEANTLYPESLRVGIFHHGFRGAKVGPLLEYQVREEIDASELQGHDFRRSFVGHYHQRQFIEGTDDLAMYIGSPLEHVRGDGGLEKGFLVYDSAPDVWKLVPLKRPRFVKLTQDLIDKTGKWTDVDIQAVVSGNFVDVVYEELPVEWDVYAKTLLAVGAAGVKAVPIVKERKRAARLAIDTSLSTQDILKKYILYKKDSLAGMDEIELLKLGSHLASGSLK